MIQHIYGEFEEDQFEGHKKKLHNQLFWLLLYKDPKTKDEYANIDFDSYFTTVMKEIDGLNILLSYPTPIVRMMSILEHAYSETKRDDYQWSSYRKLILDAQHIVDQI